MNTPTKIILCALAATVHGFAQDTTIAEAEASFRRTTAEAISPITDKYIVALGNLARKYGREGQTDDAKIVIAELERIRDASEAGKHPLETLPGRATTSLDNTDPSAPAGGSFTGDVYLTPDQATLTGRLEPHKTTGILRWFLTENDVATWSLEKFTPGTYDLILDYSCPEEGENNEGGGSIMVIAGNAQTIIPIVPAGTNRDFRKTVVGGITLTTPPVEISIGTVESTTSWGVFRLRALILRPRG